MEGGFGHQCLCSEEMSSAGIKDSGKLWPLCPCFLVIWLATQETGCWTRRIFGLFWQGYSYIFILACCLADPLWLTLIALSLHFWFNLKGKFISVFRDMPLSLNYVFWAPHILKQTRKALHDLNRGKGLTWVAGWIKRKGFQRGFFSLLPGADNKNILSPLI